MVEVRVKFRQKLQTGRGFEREQFAQQAQQQQPAGAIDTHTQPISAAIAVVTLAETTREYKKLWLCRLDMRGPNG